MWPAPSTYISKFEADGISVTWSLLWDSRKSFWTSLTKSDLICVFTHYKEGSVPLNPCHFSKQYFDKLLLLGTVQLLSRNWLFCILPPWGINCSKGEGFDENPCVSATGIGLHFPDKKGLNVRSHKPINFLYKSGPFRLSCRPKSNRFLNDQNCY